MKDKLAAKYYDDMMESYRDYIDGEISNEDFADIFIEAAVMLCDLGLPNPFADLAGETFKMNAAIRPNFGRIVTGVKE